MKYKTYQEIQKELSGITKRFTEEKLGGIGKLRNYHLYELIIDVHDFNKLKNGFLRKDLLFEKCYIYDSKSKDAKTRLKLKEKLNNVKFINCIFDSTLDISLEVDSLSMIDCIFKKDILIHDLTTRNISIENIYKHDGVFKINKVYVNGDISLKSVLMNKYLKTTETKPKLIVEKVKSISVNLDAIESSGLCIIKDINSTNFTLKNSIKVDDLVFKKVEVLHYTILSGKNENGVIPLITECNFYGLFDMSPEFIPNCISVEYTHIEKFGSNTNISDLINILNSSLSDFYKRHSGIKMYTAYKVTFDYMATMRVFIDTLSNQGYYKLRDIVSSYRKNLLKLKTRQRSEEVLIKCPLILNYLMFLAINIRYLFYFITFGLFSNYGTSSFRIAISTISIYIVFAGIIFLQSTYNIPQSLVISGGNITTVNLDLNLVLGMRDVSKLDVIAFIEAAIGVVMFSYFGTIFITNRQKSYI